MATNPTTCQCEIYQTCAVCRADGTAPVVRTQTTPTTAPCGRDPETCPDKGGMFYGCQDLCVPIATLPAQIRALIVQRRKERFMSDPTTARDERAAAVAALDALTGCRGGLHYSELGLWVVKHASVIRAALAPPADAPCRECKGTGLSRLYPNEREQPCFRCRRSAWITSEITKRLDGFTKASCDECDDCGKVAMCSYHSLLSELDELRRVSKAPADALSQEEWQPMETAPRDGEPILLRIPDYRWPDVGHWFGGKNGGWWVVHALEVHPTAWAALPGSDHRRQANEEDHPVWKFLDSLRDMARQSQTRTVRVSLEDLENIPGPNASGVLNQEERRLILAAVMRAECDNGTLNDNHAPCKTYEEDSDDSDLCKHCRWPEVHHKIVGWADEIRNG